MGRLLVSLVEGEREDGSCKEPSAGDRVEPSRRDASLVGVDGQAVGGAGGRAARGQDEQGA